MFNSSDKSENKSEKSLTSVFDKFVNWFDNEESNIFKFRYSKGNQTFQRPLIETYNVEICEEKKVVLKKSEEKS
jgi:hypothetical protein